MLLVFLICFRKHHSSVIEQQQIQHAQQRHQRDKDIETNVQREGLSVIADVSYY